MSIDVTTVSVPINVSASGTKVEATVSGGIGPAGTAATITIGTVTTGAAGSSAAVVNAGSTSAAVLNFTIPAGATGPQGPAGPPGTTTWAGITDKPATFAPAAHTHAPAEVGLGNVDNTADASKPVSTAQAAADAAVASAAAADATSKANAAQAHAIQRANHTGTQAISTVSGLQAALDAKQPAGSYADASHGHDIGAVNGLQAALDAKATPADVTAAVAAVVDAAPAALDTLNELAAALGDDANFASTVTTALAGKAAAVHGHVIADVTGLQDALNGKQVAGSYAEAVHFHSIQDVMNLESELNGKQAAGSYADAVHAHPIADVTGLQAALDGKAATSHTHVIANVTGLQAALDGKQAAGSYAAATHGHTIADVTGLQAALDGKQAAGSYAATVHTHGISDVTGLQAALDGKAETTHGHAIADVTGLQTALDGKQASGSYAAASHGHVIGDVTGLQTALDGKQAAGSYAAATHGHVIGDVTGLQAVLDGKQAAGSYAAASHTHAIADVTGLQTSLDGKASSVHGHAIADVTGLQTALDGKQAAGSYAAATHTHAAGDITSGTIASARLPVATVAQSVAGTSASTLVTPQGMHLSRRGSGRSKFFELFSDFAMSASGIDQGTDGFIWGRQVSGSGADVNTYSNRFVSFSRPGAGILSLITGTASNGRAAIDSWSDNAIFRFDQGTTYYETLIYLPTLANATDDYVLRLGFVQGNSLTNDVVAFEYNRANSVNWHGLTGWNGGYTRVDTGVAVAATKWIVLSMQFTSSACTFSINGSAVGTISSNIRPDGGTRLGSHLLKTAGTTSVSVLLDYVYYRHDFNSDRTFTP